MDIFLHGQLTFDSNPGGLSPPTAAKIGGFMRDDLIAASIYNKYSIGPSIRSIWNRCCLTMTDIVQVCSDFNFARAFIIKTRPDEIQDEATTANLTAVPNECQLFAVFGVEKVRLW